MDYRANNASDAFVNCRTLKSVWKLWYRFAFPRYISAHCVCMCVCVHTRRITSDRRAKCVSVYLPTS